MLALRFIITVLFIFYLSINFIEADTEGKKSVRYPSRDPRDFRLSILDSYITFFGRNSILAGLVNYIIFNANQC